MKIISVRVYSPDVIFKVVKDRLFPGGVAFYHGTDMDKLAIDIPEVVVVEKHGVKYSRPNPGVKTARTCKKPFMFKIDILQ